MTFELKKGNILESTVAALVNPVNIVGVKKGKGLALDFKNMYPGNFEQFNMMCRAGLVATGKMFLDMEGGKIIINFPTKKHWRDPSQYEYITEGLTDMARIIKKHQIQSIAIPALGCGNGGLDWEKVKPMIIEYMNPLDVHVELYEPI